MIKQLLPLLASCNLTITFSENEGTVTLIVAAKTKNKEATKFKPIVLSGTIEEVEEGWIEAITVPLEKVKGLQMDTAAFDKSVTSVIEEAKQDAQKKEKAAKKAEPKVAEKKPAELIKEYVSRGDKAFADKDYVLAEKCYEDALVHKPTDKVITKKLEDAKRWVKAKANLFEEPKESAADKVIVEESLKGDLHNENVPEEEHEGPGESEDNAKDEDFNLLD